MAQKTTPLAKQSKNNNDTEARDQDLIYPNNKK